MAAKKSCQENGKVRVNGFDEVPRPFIIGVCGGTASGKSTVCAKIMEALGQNKIDSTKKQVVIISMDSFYRPLTEEEQLRAKKGQYNFDHPGAFNDDLVLQILQDLKAGRTVQIPQYDPVKHCRTPGAFRTIYPTDVILFEGILGFYFRNVRNLFNMKLFVDTDADTRLSRRVMRDMKEWGRDLDQILHQYTTYVKPAFEEFCLPTKKHADVIIPRGADNTVAIDLIVQHIQELLRPSKNGRKPRVRHNSDSLVSRPH